MKGIEIMRETIIGNLNISLCKKLVFLSTLLVICSPLIMQSKFISGGDTFFPIFIKKNIRCWGFSWIDQLYMGFHGITFHNLIPTLLPLIVIPPIISQKILIIFVFLLSFVGMYFLVNQLSITFSVSSKYVASVLYSINPFTLLLLNPPQYPVIIAYSISPLILGMFIRAIRTYNYKWIAFIIVLLFLFSWASSNPPAYLIMLVPLYLYSLFSFNKKNIRFIMVLTIGIITVNLWWLSQYLFLNPQQLSFSASRCWVGFTSVNAKLTNIFRFLGSWAFKAYAFGSPYFPYFKWYYTPLAISIALIILMLPILALMMNYNSTNRDFYFFGMLFIISLFLVKGSNPPFGKVFLWIYQTVPGFYIFREPWAKFMPLFILSFCVLVSYSMEYVLNIFKRKKLYCKFFPLVVILIILIYSWPFFTGDVFPKERGYFPGLRIEIPTYWVNLSNYIDKHTQDDARILLLPSNPFYQVHYFWWYDGYYGIDPTPYFIFRPLIITDPGGGYVKPPASIKIMNIFYQKYLRDNFPMWKFFAIMNVKYILHRKDLDWTHIGTRSSLEEPKVVRAKLQKQPYIHLASSFGRFCLEKVKTDQWFLRQIRKLNGSVLDFYMVDDGHTFPHIYPSTSNAISYDKLTTMANIIEISNFNNLPIFINRFHLKLNLSTLNFSKTSPNLTFRKVNPTKYEVEIENASFPFFLVFSESYHPKWKVYVDTSGDQRKAKWKVIANYPKFHVKEARHDWYKFTPQDIKYLFKKPLPEKYHLLVNGYANAWFIDPNEIGKQNFTITLYFWPQSLFYLSLFISGVTLLGCLGYLGYERIKG